jgi:excinuclease ABC subunit B
MTDSIRALPSTKPIAAAKNRSSTIRKNGVEPRTTIRAINDSPATILKADDADLTDDLSPTAEELTFNTQADLDTYIAKLETDMREAPKKFEFEKAATLRDTIKDLRTKEFLFS